MRALVTNPGLRETLGRAGRRYVEKYHSYAAAQFTEFLPKMPELPVVAELTSQLTKLAPAMAIATGVTGLFGVFASVRVYAVTRRAHWRGSVTGLRFFSTTVLLGAATTYAVGVLSVGSAPTQGKLLLGLVAATTLLKLAFEASLLFERQNRQNTVGKRMALLMTRELGLLRAVGTTRRQVRRMIRWEAVIVATFGTIGGIGLGVGLGWALTRAALADSTSSPFDVPVPTMVMVLIFGVLVGVIAAARPAYRAAKMEVLGAVSAE